MPTHSATPNFADASINSLPAEERDKMVNNRPVKKTKTDPAKPADPSNADRR